MRENRRQGGRAQREKEQIMKKYRYIFWDLDGTLLDTYEGVSKCVQYALKFYGIQIEDRETLRKFIGPPLRESFPRLAHLPEKDVEDAVARYRERYHPVGVFECRPFEGVKEVIDAFHRAGKIQVVSSSKPEEMCRKVLGKFHMTDCFDEIVGASEDGRIDTKSEVLAEAFRRLRAQDASFALEDAVLIGDTRFDAEGAAAVGIDCVGVSYGFGTREELLACGARRVFDSPEELEVL